MAITSWSGCSSGARRSPAQRTPKELLELVRVRGSRELSVKTGMDAGRADRVDDLAIEVGSDQPDVVAVVGQRHRECRAHHARPEDDDRAHAPASVSTAAAAAPSAIRSSGASTLAIIRP
jgi:hypothetical protein